MKHGRIVAILDACVLHPLAIRDFLLNLAYLDLYDPKWSRKILAERAISLQRRSKLTDEQIYSAEQAMNQAFPDAMVNGVRLRNLRLPDMNDVHVLAAAIECNADAIVTFNLKDFPIEILRRYHIVAEHPDAFCEALIRSNPEDAVEAFELQRLALKRPRFSVEEMLEGLSRDGVPKSVKLLKGLLRFG